jgi:phosphatidylserine synthase 2
LRIFLWGFVALATSKEWYEYITNPNSNRLGPFAWIAIYVALVEFSGVIKFRGNSFDAPLPQWVFFMWGTVGIFWSFGLYISSVNGSQLPKSHFDPYNP